MSARLALRAKLGEPTLWAASRFGALEQYLHERLDERERLRLKLANPLGVGRALADRYLGVVNGRLELLQEDVKLLDDVERQNVVYRDDMSRQFALRMSEIENVLLQLEQRGHAYFDEMLRIGRVIDLLNKARVREGFQKEVVADAPRQIEDVVNRMVDWTVKRNLKLWTAVFQELDAHTARLRASGALAAHASTEFQYNREDLFERLRQPVERRLNEFNAEAEARGVVESVREAVTHAFGINVLAVGLGAVVMAVFTTAALDLTGLLTATLFALAGWLLIPARRRRLVRELEEKIAKLSTDLSALLAAKFNEQLTRYEQELLDVIQPYERFLATEREKLERGLTELRGVQQETTTLEHRVMETFPERVAS